jgi:hypothetical protein
MADDLIVQAIQRAYMGFPPGFNSEPQGMMWFELALERAILGMPSAPLHAAPNYDFLLYRQSPTPAWMEE